LEQTPQHPPPLVVGGTGYGWGPPQSRVWFKWYKRWAVSFCGWLPLGLNNLCGPPPNKYQPKNLYQMSPPPLKTVLGTVTNPCLGKMPISQLGGGNEGFKKNHWVALKPQGPLTPGEWGTQNCETTPTTWTPHKGFLCGCWKNPGGNKWGGGLWVI